MGDLSRDDLEALTEPERRRLAYQWADRAVREHARSALEAGSFWGGAKALQRMPELRSRRDARRAVWRCLTVATGTGLVGLVGALFGRTEISATTRALYVLLDAGQAALVAAAVEDGDHLKLVGERVASAARSAPYRAVAASAMRGSRAWAAGPCASAEVAEEDELNAQRSELKFSLALADGGGARRLADRTESLAELAGGSV